MPSGLVEREARAAAHMCNIWSVLSSHNDGRLAGLHLSGTLAAKGRSPKTAASQAFGET